MGVLKLTNLASGCTKSENLTSEYLRSQTNRLGEILNLKFEYFSTNKSTTEQTTEKVSWPDGIRGTCRRQEEAQNRATFHEGSTFHVIYIRQPATRGRQQPVAETGGVMTSQLPLPYPTPRAFFEGGSTVQSGRNEVY